MSARAIGLVDYLSLVSGDGDAALARARGEGAEIVAICHCWPPGWLIGAPVSRLRSINLPEIRVLCSLSSAPGGNSAGNSTSDAEVPGADEVFWYLVRGTNPCGTGPYGFQSESGAPTIPRISATCP